MKNQRAMIRGLLFGWLVGSTVALVYAPRRGEQTRLQIRDKSLELKDGMNRSIVDARQRSEQVIRSSADRAAELIQQGQALLDEQKATIVSTVKGVQAGVQAYAEYQPGDREMEGGMDSSKNATQVEDIDLGDTDIRDTGTTL